MGEVVVEQELNKRNWVGKALPRRVLEKIRRKEGQRKPVVKIRKILGLAL